MFCSCGSGSNSWAGGSGLAPFQSADLIFLNGPILTIQPAGTPPAVLGPDQRIGIDDALRAITLDAAYQLFMEDKIGSLEPGKLADLVILSDNPRTIPIANIRSIQVISTYLGGVRRF